jgi:two-component system sensor histidine kinase HydH
MSLIDRKENMLPGIRPKRYFPLPALGFILACLVLAGALAFVTWNNLDREERMMAKFLLSESQTLIRAFEAGARTSMMMESRGGTLATLVEETAREKTVAYILIVDETGKVIASAGKPPEIKELIPNSEVLKSKTPLTRSHQKKSSEAVFEVAELFSPLNSMPKQMGMMSRWQNWCGIPEQNKSSRQVIYLGLYTTDFDAARAEDIKQSLILLGILFLLGSSGLYVLFLSQKSQVAKAALENMELYTNNVIHSMPAGLISIDNEQKIISVNRNAREYFGCSRADMLGKTLPQLTGLKESALPSLLLTDKEFVDQPMEYLRPDGETIPLKASASHLRDRDGNLRGMVLILRDQREIRAMEEALERSRRHAALGRMAAGIAHEIRNPLGTLRGFAQYFSTCKNQDEKAHEYADLMVGEVDRLNRTVSALLQFSRPREPDMVEIDLCALTQRAITFIQADADSQRVRLKLNQPKSDLKVSADPDLLQQLLLNLLQNSLAATPAEGEIELGIKQLTGEIELWVQDSGKGLTAEDQAKMFDPFYTTKNDGTGLGLVMVQQIVEQHNGRIDVETELGQGTCIRVTLPQKGYGDEYS